MRALTAQPDWTKRGTGVSDPLEGTPYRTISPLASGGMGEVVLAEHRELGRTFAVKLLLKSYADDVRLVDRLRVEARILGALEHDNVVGVFGFDVTPDGRPYLVMEHLRGCTLSERLRADGNLDVYEAVRVISQLLAGLEAAHAKGIVHRDVKPTNIFLAESFGSTKVKLLDFGIGKVLVDGDVPKPQYATEEGMMVGTPRFSAPEQIVAQAVDARTDLYAVGLVAYTLLAGRGPFDDIPDTKMLLRAHLGDVPKPPSAFSPTPLPSELDALVLKALEKKPERRFQSATEMKESMQAASRLLQMPVGFAETTTWDPGELRATRNEAPEPEPTFPNPVVVPVNQQVGEEPELQLAATMVDGPRDGASAAPTLHSPPARVRAESGSGQSFVLAVVVGGVVALLVGLLAWHWMG